MRGYEDLHRILLLRLLEIIKLDIMTQFMIMAQFMGEDLLYQVNRNKGNKFWDTPGLSLSLGAWILKIWKMPFKLKSNGRPPRLLRFRGRFRGHQGQNFENHLVFITFHYSIFSFWVSRSFDLGDLGVHEKSPVNIFNDYIFEISLFHWSKCTIECTIRLTLILKSAQARCDAVSFIMAKLEIVK